MASLHDPKEWVGTVRAFEASRELLDATLARNDEIEASLLEAAHRPAANPAGGDIPAVLIPIRETCYS